MCGLCGSECVYLLILCWCVCLSACVFVGVLPCGCLSINLCVNVCVWGLSVFCVRLSLCINGCRFVCVSGWYVFVLGMFVVFVCSFMYTPVPAWLCVCVCLCVVLSFFNG